MSNSRLANLTSIPRTQTKLAFSLFLLRATSGLTLPCQIVTPATDTSRVGHNWPSLTMESLDLFHFAELFTPLVTLATSGKFIALPAEAKASRVLAGAVLWPHFQLGLRPASIHHPELKTTALIATCRQCKVEALPVFFKRYTFNS